LRKKSLSLKAENKNQLDAKIIQDNHSIVDITDSEGEAEAEAENVNAKANGDANDQA
jgi:hypothetical protein